MDTIAHLLRHDSTYGTWQRRVDTDGEFLAVDDRPLRVLQQPDPARLDWKALGVDVVVEATGHFRSREHAAAHLTAGARKVVLTAPGTDVDATSRTGTVSHACRRYRAPTPAGCPTAWSGTSSQRRGVEEVPR